MNAVVIGVCQKWLDTGMYSVTINEVKTSEKSYPVTFNSGLHASARHAFNIVAKKIKCWGKGRFFFTNLSEKNLALESVRNDARAKKLQLSIGGNPTPNDWKWKSKHLFGGKAYKLSNGTEVERIELGGSDGRNITSSSCIHHSNTNGPKEFRNESYLNKFDPDINPIIEVVLS